MILLRIPVRRNQHNILLHPGNEINGDRLRSSEWGSADCTDFPLRLKMQSIRLGRRKCRKRSGEFHFGRERLSAWQEAATHFLKYNPKRQHLSVSTLFLKRGGSPFTESPVRWPLAELIYPKYQITSDRFVASGRFLYHLGT